jgi:hypothetical protein
MQLTVLHSRRSRYAPMDIIISIIQVSASPPGAVRRLPGPGFPARPGRGARQRLSRNLWAAPIKR